MSVNIFLYIFFILELSTFKENYVQKKVYTDIISAVNTMNRKQFHFHLLLHNRAHTHTLTHSLTTITVSLYHHNSQTEQHQYHCIQ